MVGVRTRAGAGAGAEAGAGARRFPALVNNTIIDWFHPWPADALQSVSERFLGEVELGEDEVKDAIIRFMPFSFVEVNSASDRFLSNEKRYNYTTPKSFLELIALYKMMLQNKRDTTQNSQDRLQQGLDKLQGTAKAVGELEEFLKVKSVEVEEKIAAAEVLSEKVGKEKEICNREGDAAAIEKGKCEQIQVEVGQKQEDCERDLAAALPAVAKAMEALDTINKKDLGELKALKKPPSGIDDVMGAVMDTKQARVLHGHLDRQPPRRHHVAVPAPVGSRDHRLALSPRTSHRDPRQRTNSKPCQY